MQTKLQIFSKTITRICVSHCIFLILFILLFFLYDLQDLMMKPPQGLHIWRQTDCLSLTQNFFDGTATLFNPEMHNQLSDNNSTGKTAGEFPILYWAIAQIWKITGKYEFIYRIVGLLITFGGLFSLFRLSLSLTGNIYISPLIGLLPFTSPVYVNYSISFLPNIPAISFVFIGWAIFYQFIREKKPCTLWFSLLFLSLATLIKVSAGISFVALSCWIIIESVFRSNKDRIFNSPIKQMVPFILSWLAIISWYAYASKYNTVHGGRYTFNNIWPIWELTIPEIKERLTTARILWKNQLLSHWVLWFLISLWPVTLIYIRKLPIFIRYLLISIPVGTFAYLILWFQALRDHDYYYIEIVLPVLLFIITILSLLRKSGRLKIGVTSTVILIIFIFSVVNCRKSYYERSTGWMNSWFTNNLEAVYETSPLLKELGIPGDAIIISVPDPSINVTLYFLNRKGFTDFGSDFSQPGVIQDRIVKGARYLIVNDSSIFENALFKPYLEHKLMSHRNVTVFDLMPYSEI